MPDAGNQRGVENGNHQERGRVGKDWRTEISTSSEEFRDNVQVKKFIQETGRSKMEEEHMARLTVHFPNQSGFSAFAAFRLPGLDEHIVAGPYRVDKTLETNVNKVMTLTQDTSASTMDTGGIACEYLCSPSRL